MSYIAQILCDLLFEITCEIDGARRKVSFYMKNKAHKHKDTHNVKYKHKLNKLMNKINRVFTSWYQTVFIYLVIYRIVKSNQWSSNSKVICTESLMHFSCTISVGSTTLWEIGFCVCLFYRTVKPFIITLIDDHMTNSALWMGMNHRDSQWRNFRNEYNSFFFLFRLW